MMNFIKNIKIKDFLIYKDKFSSSDPNIIEITYSLCTSLILKKFNVPNLLMPTVPGRETLCCNY